MKTDLNSYSIEHSRMGQASAVGASANDMLRQARRLRAERRIVESHKLVRPLASDPRYRPLIWQHDPQLWKPLQGRNCRLTRRCGSDAGFLRWLWNNKDFMRQFNRLAAPLPICDEELDRTLESEFVALLKDAKAVHWVIRDGKDHPWGLLSLKEVSLRHKRAEVVIGVLPGAPFGLAATAMLLLFQFFFTTLKFNRLYAYTYADNEAALHSALRLGFRTEGLLRQHMFDPTQRTYLDAQQIAILSDEVYCPRIRTLRERLITHDARPLVYQRSHVTRAVEAADVRLQHMCSELRESSSES